MKFKEICPVEGASINIVGTEFRIQHLKFGIGFGFSHLTRSEI